MSSCCVPECKYRSSTKNKKQKALEEKGIKITFHTFPRNEERRSLWIKVIRRERDSTEWIPHSKSVICSMHFLEKHFDRSSRQVTRLTDRAVPCIFDYKKKSTDVSRLTKKIANNQTQPTPLPPELGFVTPHLVDQLPAITCESHLSIFQKKKLKRKCRNSKNSENLAPKNSK